MLTRRRAADVLKELKFSVPRVPPVYRIKEENGREMYSFYFELELLGINRDPDPFY
jgi:hypothetical protein